MHLEDTCGAKPFPAIQTLMRFLVGMLGEVMLFQDGGSSKRLSTLTTLVWLFPSVGEPMKLEAVSVGERPSALLTLVRLLSGVSTMVPVAAR